MRVLMDQRVVPVDVHVRLPAIPRESVRVLVMFVMPMRVRMLHRLVYVFMLVPLAQMQPYAKRHQGCGHPEQDARDLRPNQEGNHHAKQRRDREVRPGARGAQVPQRHHEQRQADTVPLSSNLVSSKSGMLRSMRTRFSVS